MTEQQIQSKKIKELESPWLLCFKIEVKTNKNGIPDLLALHPDKTINSLRLKHLKERFLNYNNIE